MKKIIGLLLCVCMVFTMSTTVLAYPDVEEGTYVSDAISILSNLGIVNGYVDGNFKPNASISRAEMAKMICETLGYDRVSEIKTPFNDVEPKHWASGYINTAYNLGIINGYGNGNFGPEDTITFEQAVKMMVCALGYEPMAAQKGGWPTGYLTVANSIKMTANISDFNATRGTVAQLIANAIEIPVMDQVSYGTITTYEPLDEYDNYKTILTSKDIYIGTGTIVDINEIDNEFEFKFTECSDDFEFGYNNKGSYLETFIGSSKTYDIGESNVTSYIGQHVNVYFQKINKIDYVALFAIPTGIGNTVTVNIEDFEGNINISKTSRSIIEYYETKDATKTSKLYIEKNPVVKVNGVIVTNPIDFDKYTTEVASVTFTENSNDKYYDIIDITIYEYGIVEDIKVTKDRIEFIDGNRIIFDTQDDEQIVNIYDINGNEIGIEDIEINDVLAMVVCDVDTYGNIVPVHSFKDKIIIYNLGQSYIEGAVYGWNSDENKFTINGKDYEYISTNWVADDVDEFLSDPVGSDGIFYIGIDGRIIGFDGDSVINGNYGFIIQSQLNSTGFEPHYEIKLLTEKGIVIYDVDTKCEIDNVDTMVESQSLSFNKYNDDPVGRFIKYNTNKAGEIDEINFVNGDSVDGKCNITSSSIKIDGEKLDNDAIIFDISKDIDDAKVINISTLIDDVEYKGYVFNLGSTRENDVFVMTSGNAVFEDESHFFVVDSVINTIYDDDDAKIVYYYTNGENRKYSAIFTDDSNSVYGNYTELEKGSIFVANLDTNDCVIDYAVIAVALNENSINASIFNSEDVEIVYGYIDTIEKNDVELIGSDRVYDITNATAQYCYNTNGAKPKIDVGIWDTVNVDEYDATNNEATFVVMKLFDDEVIDIISVTERRVPNVSLSGVDNDNKIVEEDIVEVEEIYFE